MEQNRTILVVDDEAEALRGYEAFLSPEGGSAPRKSSRRGGGAPADSFPTFRLLSASTGEQAVELVRQELAAGRRVSAGFFDVKLGVGMDGLSAIQAIRALDKDIHCVVVTAYQDRTVDEIARLLGDDFSDQWDYLNKPFSQGEVLQKARQMTAAWNRKRQIETLTQHLIKSERLASIGQVARGVGHEFGNILLRIMGKADLALMEGDQAKQQEHLKVILQASERASVIVRNLQSVSRTSRSGPDFRQSSLCAPLEEALSLISHECTKASVKVERAFSEAPETRMDSGAIAQVFLNLLINAIHAMPNGGKIRVSVDRETGPDGRPGVIARVADSGSGIPADVLPRIFEFAFSTKGDRGSGLGLAISREIVEGHDGMIRVSTTVGKGTEFSVWLPELKG